jgi:sensor c-di-GMP phosphodiesterase-like protein
MKFRWPGIASLSIAVACTAAFAVGGHFAATALLDGQRLRQLHELASVALRRSELSVDFGAATLDELARRGLASCDAAALQAVRLVVYQRGAVKDIRVVGRDGGVLCSAYSETLEFDKGWVSRDEMRPASDAALRVFRVDQFFGVALGLLRDIDARTSLAAILGVNESLYDIMPGELVDRSEVSLRLEGGEAIIQSPSRLKPSAAVVSVSAASARYPLRAIIRVDQAALGRWDNEPYAPMVGLSALVGLAFGILLARLFVRPPGPLAEFDKALANHEFRPFLQPVVNLHTGAIIGCEALARWVRADGSVLPPSRFIGLAEATGRIEPLTRQIVSAALNGLRPVLQSDKTFKVSFNIAPQHLLAPGFVADLRGIVSAARISFRQVVLEVTEREAFHDLARATAVVAELREFGFGVALDDVGIGHSGLSYIQQLRASTLKIDKFFVDSIDRDPAAKAVVEMVVRLARELKMNVVAEGIEDRAQIAALIACGIEQGQGYLVSPPVPVDAFLGLLDRQSPESGRRDEGRAVVDAA